MYSSWYGLDQSKYSICNNVLLLFRLSGIMWYMDLLGISGLHFILGAGQYGYSYNTDKQQGLFLSSFTDKMSGIWIFLKVVTELRMITLIW